MSYMLSDAYNSLGKHRCVPSSCFEAYKQAYHQEHRKLKEASEANRSLGKMNEWLKAESDHYKLDSAAMRSRLQERDTSLANLGSRVERLDRINRDMQEAHDEALRNAADRIVNQDRKIDELLAQIKDVAAIEGQSPAALGASSPGKRRRLDEHELEQEDGMGEDGKDRKRRQTMAASGVKLECAPAE